MKTLAIATLFAAAFAFGLSGFGGHSSDVSLTQHHTRQGGEGDE